MSPAVGEMAPDFELVTLRWLLMSDEERAKAKAEAKKEDARASEGRTGGDRTSKDTTDKDTTDREKKVEDAKMGHVRLSSFRGKRPVVFALSSYT
jgi:hypothetical protein